MRTPNSELPKMCPYSCGAQWSRAFRDKAHVRDGSEQMRQTARICLLPFKHQITTETRLQHLRNVQDENMR